MSIKKTWFSYILWLIATGFSVLFIIGNVCSIMDYYDVSSSNSDWGYAVYSIVFIFASAGICILLRFIRNHIHMPALSKWIYRSFHIFVLISSIALFLITRIWSAFQAAFRTQQVMNIYELSRIGGPSKTMASLSVFEGIYVKVLSGLFLFLGNKLEVMLYLQFFLQIMTFILLIYIGWTLQKGIYAWIPVLFYSLSPFFIGEIPDMGAGNFFFFVIVCGIALICLLERVWKNKTLTYILVSLFGVICSILVVLVNSERFFDWNYIPDEVSEIEQIITIRIPSYYWEMAGLLFLVVLYIVSFWYQKTDNASLYIISVSSFLFVIFGLKLGEVELQSLSLMLIHFYLYFLCAEGMRVLFSAKTEVLTGINVTETVLPVPKPEENSFVFDKTAMIENVLPMPKKHIGRTLDYAFEPSEDMMHYDIEFENDKYDYE